MRSFKKILCPTDFSRDSTAALSMAATLAQDQTSEVLVVYVEPNIHDMVMSGALPAHQATDEYLELQNELCELIEKCIPAKVPVRVIIREGAVAPQLMQLAGEEAVDLIVVAPRCSQTSHGKDCSCASTLLSPIAQEILSGAPCAVLLVHNNFPASTAFDSPLSHSKERSHQNAS